MVDLMVHVERIEDTHEKLNKLEFIKKHYARKKPMSYILLNSSANNTQISQ